METPTLTPTSSIDEKLKEEGMQLPPWETPAVPSAPTNVVAFPERKPETLQVTQEVEIVPAPAPKKRGRPRKSDQVKEAAAPVRKPKAKEKVVQAVAKKPGRKKKEEKEVQVRETRKNPHSGQSGPVLDVPYPDLNANEKTVFSVFATHGDREERAISEIASSCYSNLREEQANSWVRNALRRLVTGNFLEKVGRGKYRQTEHGRKESKKISPA